VDDVKRVVMFCCVVTLAVILAAMGFMAAMGAVKF
jgi:hypothetical protein